jgi:hypothetical protein
MMRKLIVLIAALVLVASTGRVSTAGVGADDYDDSQSHPLRLLAYVIHPVGYTLEWLTMRPFHEFVAQPDLEPIFGHQPHTYYGESPFGASGWTAGRGVHVEQ